MAGASTVIQALRGLGLTPTEAEVYLATLTATAKGPASGYRIARDTGRDPANLGKVMASLARQGAVRVVQERPRLYEPVAPEEFTATVVAHMEARRSETLAALAARRTPTSAAPLLLPDLPAALERAAELAAAARERIALLAHPALVDPVRGALCDAAERGVTVRVLCPAPVAGCGGELTVLPGVRGDAAPWLELVVDAEAWLVAADEVDGAAGCWGRQPAVARALSATLDTLRLAGGLRCEMAVAAAEGAASAGTLTFLVRHDGPPDDRT